MKDNKKIILIAIITIVSLIVILVGVFAYAFFFTDSLKSDKQLFFKYLLKNSETFQGLKDESLENFYAKKQETPYESEGKVSVKYSLGEDSEILSEDISKLDNVSISYTGVTDVKNNYNFRKINLNYSEEEAMVINYIHSNDYFGVKIDGVLKKYLGIENNNLKEFLGKFNIDTENIPDKIDLDTIKSLLNGETELFNEEELEQIKNNYLPVLLDNLKDELFTQSETAKGKKLTLTLDEETLKNMFIQAITKLKDDELILGKIKQKYIELGNDTEEDAEELITNLKEQFEETLQEVQSEENTETTGQDTEVSKEIDSLVQEEEELNIVISMYVENKEVVQTELMSVDSKIIINKVENGILIESQEFNSETEEYEILGNITINKVKEEDSFNYEFIIDADGGIITYNVKYTGINTLAEVASNIDLKFEYNEQDDENQYLEKQTSSVYGLSYAIENKTIFKDSINTEFNIEEDGITVNEYEPEKLSSLFENLIPLVLKLNETKMKNTGFEQFPFLYYSPSAILSISIMNSAKDTINNTDLSDQAIEAYNGKFTPYEGTEITGSKVNALINVIESNNAVEADGGHIIQSLIINGVSYDISDADVQSQISTSKTYTVKTDKDSEGYIYLIDIEENAF